MKNYWLFTQDGEESKTTFWFSTTMFVSLFCVILIVGRYLADPSPEFVNGLSGIAVVLGVPVGLMTTAYTTRRIFQEKNGDDAPHA